MSWTPSYILYNSSGTGQIYTFPNVQSDNSPQDPFDYVEIDGLRGQGSIIIPGSEMSWDLELRFILCGTDYQDLISKIDTLESTIIKNTPYILKIDRTESTTKDYKVKRLQSFNFDTSFRTSIQRVTAIFRVNSWAN